MTSSLSWPAYWATKPNPDADFYRWFASRDAQTQKEILTGAPPEVVARCTARPVPVPNTQPPEWWQVNGAPRPTQQINQQPKNEALQYWQNKSIQKAPATKAPAQKIVNPKKKSRHLWTWIILGYGLIFLACVLPALLRMR